MTINKSNLSYSRSRGFSANMSGTNGPSPALIQATTAGADVDLSKLTQPGVCWIANLDASKSIVIGIHDPSTFEFYPMLEALPGEAYPVRLYRYLGEEQSTTGTGTIGSGSTLRIKGVGGTVPCLVEAFDR